MACNGRVAARSRGDHAVNDFRSDDGELLDELITDNVVAVGAYVAAVERYRGESPLGFRELTMTPWRHGS